jgi:hypothetical protein
LDAGCLMDATELDWGAQAPRHHELLSLSFAFLSSAV